MPIYRLIRAPIFPRVELADESGLLAVGGDLSIPRLLEAYHHGIFPWYEAGQPILWWSPDPRLILDLDALHISRSLRKVMRRGGFEVTADQDFMGVLRACAAPRPDSDETWLVPEMITAYGRLHRLGLAHSIEVWQEGALIGGLYGVALGGAFFGESMFSRAPNGSKLALVALVRHLKALGATLLDCQVTTEHLLSMGAEEIPREAFMERLRVAVEEDVPALPVGPWTLPEDLMEGG